MIVRDVTSLWLGVAQAYSAPPDALAGFRGRDPGKGMGRKGIGKEGKG